MILKELMEMARGRIDPRGKFMSNLRSAENAGNITGDDLCDTYAKLYSLVPDNAKHQFSSPQEKQQQFEYGNIVAEDILDDIDFIVAFVPDQHFN